MDTITRLAKTRVLGRIAHMPELAQAHPPQNLLKSALLRIFSGRPAPIFYGSAG